MYTYLYTERCEIMAKMARISEDTSKKIDELAELLSVSKQKVIDIAVKSYEKELFFKRLDADYAALKKDAKAWKEFQDEMAEWDVTLQDRLNNE